MIYQYRLEIAPRGQKRDRIGTLGGHARSYKDAEQASYETTMRALLSYNKPSRLIEGPVNVSIICFLPIPSAWSKKKKREASQPIPLSRIRPTVKPDADNIAKQALDCMNGLIYRDDKQVVGLEVRKWYSTEPRWEITVEEVVYYD